MTSPSSVPNSLANPGGILPNPSPLPRPLSLPIFEALANPGMSSADSNPVLSSSPLLSLFCPGASALFPCASSPLPSDKSSEVSSLYLAPPNLVDGSIFYTTDTNKEYVLYNNTWTEV